MQILYTVVHIVYATLFQFAFDWNRQMQMGQRQADSGQNGRRTTRTSYTGQDGCNQAQDKKYVREGKNAGQNWGLRKYSFAYFREIFIFSEIFL